MTSLDPRRQLLLELFQAGLKRPDSSIEQVLEDVCAAARARGLSVSRAAGCFEGDARRLAVRMAHELDMYPEAVRVWGGKTHAEGAPCQYLALAAARLIAGREDLLMLVAGTDGTDGQTEDAGGLVDGETCARIAIAELDIERCLESADSSAALACAGDLIHTGPTGSHAGDIVIGLKLAANSTSARS